MRDDLLRRISAAIDSPKGIDGDPELRQLLAADPDAAAYAHDVARLGRILREWPLAMPDDDAFEALASRIEQRLDDDAGLAPIGDPTAPPQFDDDDDLRDATAGLLGSVVASSEIELESIPPAPPALGAGPPTGAPPKPGVRPAPPKPAAIPAPKAGAAPVPKTVPTPAPPAATPPPPPAGAAPSAPPAAREIPKLVPASKQAEERLSFPSLAPPPIQLAPGPTSLAARRERTRKVLGWISGLSAAAAVGLGVFAAVQMARPEQLASVSAPALQSAAPALAPSGAADVESVAAFEPAPAEMPAPAGAMPAGAPAPGAGGSALAEEVADGEMNAAAPLRSPRADASSAGAERASVSRRRAAASGARPASAPARVASAPRLAQHFDSGASATGASSTASAAPRASAASRARSAPVATGDLPDQPSRGEVQAALQAVEPAVRACAQGARGTAQVRIVVVGSSGRVTIATVSGQFAGTPVGSCVARAVRAARFPRFAAERFEITYPFQL